MICALQISTLQISTLSEAEQTGALILRYILGGFSFF